MYDIDELYRIKNALLKSDDPEEVLIGRLINTIIIARDKKELDKLSEVISQWIQQRTK